MKDRGWHRHQWDAAAESAKHGKLPVADLDGVSNGEEPLMRGFDGLKISPGAGDHELLDA